jgi:hypothetical protein
VKKFALILMLSVTAASAARVRQFAWISHGGDSFRLYRNGKLVATVTTTNAAALSSVGDVFTVTAVTAGRESKPSAPVKIR